MDSAKHSATNHKTIQYKLIVCHRVLNQFFYSQYSYKIFTIFKFIPLALTNNVITKINFVLYKITHSWQILGGLKSEKAFQSNVYI